MVTAEWWLSCIVSSLSHFLSSPSFPFLSASFSSHSHFFPLSSGIHHDSRLHCLGLAAISYDKRALKSLPRSLTSLDGIGKFSSTSLSCFPPQRFVAVHHQKWVLFPLRNLHGNHSTVWSISYFSFLTMYQSSYLSPGSQLSSSQLDRFFLCQYFFIDFILHLCIPEFCVPRRACAFQVPESTLLYLYCSLPMTWFAFQSLLMRWCFRILILKLALVRSPAAEVVIWNREVVYFTDI